MVDIAVPEVLGDLPDAQPSLREEGFGFLHAGRDQVFLRALRGEFLEETEKMTAGKPGPTDQVIDGAETFGMGVQFP